MQFLPPIKISDYDYPLPESKIARYPLPERDHSKLLVYDKKRPISQDVFYRLPEYLPPETMLVFNNTKVIHARLLFQKPSGAGIEIFCLYPVEPPEYNLTFQKKGDSIWACMIGNSKRWKKGFLRIAIPYAGCELILQAEKVGISGNVVLVRFSWNDPDVDFAGILDRFGNVPLPPYLNREAEESDKTAYQTVYSRIKGSVAAPTAGLHFTRQIFEKLEEKKIQRTEITLHVGAGTFQPVKEESVAMHRMHTEFFEVSQSAISIIIEHIDSLVAVGTTSVRTIESLYWLGVKLAIGNLPVHDHPAISQWDPYTLNSDMPQVSALECVLYFMKERKLDLLQTSTSLMIVPGYQFRLIKGLITNYHLPKSTLLLLVAAFIGDDWKGVYRYALANHFRFLSYGDSSLLFP